MKRFALTIFALAISMLLAPAVALAQNVPSYTSGQVVNGRGFSAMALTCTVAPSSGTFSISPDNNNDFIAQTVTLNNSSGITTTANITQAGTYFILIFQQYFVANFTNGTCFLVGVQ